MKLNLQVKNATVDSRDGSVKFHVKGLSREQLKRIVDALRNIR